MKNTKLHSVGDIVYVQEYCWPAGIVKYKITGITTSTSRPTVYELEFAEGSDLKRSAWAYRVFDNTDDAFNYRYQESYQSAENA